MYIPVKKLEELVQVLIQIIYIEKNLSGCIKTNGSNFLQFPQTDVAITGDYCYNRARLVWTTFLPQSIENNL